MASRSYLTSRAIDGPVGIGWSSSVTSRIYYAVYLFAPPSTYQKVAYVIMPSGARWSFVENGSSFTPPWGRKDSLVHNGDGSWDLTLERSLSRLHFDATGALTSMLGDYGNAINFTYTSGRVQQIADAAGSGRYLNVGWGPDGRISTITDNSGRYVQYGYSGQGTLTSVRDGAARTSTYGYTTVRFGPVLNQVKDPWNRVVTDITYDAKGRTQSYTEDGETWTYEYEYGGSPSVTAKRDSAGNLWRFTFDAHGLITDRTPPIGASTATVYTADGALQQLTDGVGVKTYTTYDGIGGVQSVTKDYLGNQALRYDYAYDPAFPGRVASVTPKNPSDGSTNLDWQGWRYEFYQAGTPAPGALFRVKRVRNDGVTLDTLATYEYNSKGRVTRLTSATGGMTDYTYDAQGNLWTITAPANNDAGTRPVTTFGYDSLGRVTSVTDALNHATTYAYDGLNRVASVTLPKPTTGSTLNFATSYDYDNFDAPTGLVFTDVTDPNGRVTRQGYDQYGQLVRVADTLGALTQYGYVKGLLTSVTDGNNNVTSYEYNPRRQLLKTTFPDGTYETYTYWDDGLPFSTTDRKGAMTSRVYDHLKRVTELQIPGYLFQDYTYVGQKMTQVLDGSVNPYETTMLSYDVSYRLASVTEGTRGTLTYLYNGDDTPQSASVQSGPSTSYTYYPDASLNTIVWSPVAGSFKYRYTLPGQYQSITMPSGATRNVTYDDQGRLTNLTNLKSGGTNLATYAYGYDLNYTTGQYTMLGQRASMTATVPSQSLSNHLFKYEYDTAYQLNKVTYPNVAPFSSEIDSWTYDLIGNRLTSTVNGATTNYTYQKIGSNPLNWQRLTSDGANSYTYDNNGSTLTRGTTAFTWNTENQMSGVTGTASYVYDYEGRRASKTVGASTSTYLYDGLNLTQETGATPADYLFGPGIDEPLAMRRGGSTYYYVADGLGSLTLLTDSGGTVQDKYLYDAWGQVRSSATPVVNPFGYTGRETGEAATLFYRARYYQPGVGRFLQEDPMRERSGDLNFYRYVLNRPITSTDPSGMLEFDESCSCPKPGGPSAPPGFRGPLISAVVHACNSLDRITDPKLRACMQKTCESGTIECLYNCPHKDVMGHTDFIFFGVVNRTSGICVQNIGSGGPQLTDVVLHEFAHGCKWEHYGGKGVPGQSGEGID